jgi:hypothetical protein
MARSRLLFAGVALAIGLIASGPANADGGAGAAFEVAKAAGATMSSGSLVAEAFGFNGVALTTSPGVVNWQFGCAVVGNLSSARPIPGGESGHAGPDLIDVGCGRLSVTVDPLLQTATLKGTLRSWIYDYETGEEGGPSKIVVNLTFAGAGLIRPIISQSEFVDAQPLPPAAFLFASVGTGAGRNAIAKGSISSATLGAVSGQTDQAVVFEGANIYVGAYAF